MICVATSASPDLVSRLDLAQQRALADEAQRRASWIAAPMALKSRSHSRGLGGAAVTDASCAAVGFDIEYVDARRDWPSIAAYMLGDDAHLVDIFRLPRANICMGWTLLEAHFKAFGDRAAPEDIAAAMRNGGSNPDPSGYSNGRWRQHKVLNDTFCATVVWETGEFQIPEWL